MRINIFIPLGNLWIERAIRITVLGALIVIALSLWRGVPGIGLIWAVGALFNIALCLRRERLEMQHMEAFLRANLGKKPTIQTAEQIVMDRHSEAERRMKEAQWLRQRELDDQLATLKRKHELRQRRLLDEINESLNKDGKQ